MNFKHESVENEKSCADRDTLAWANMFFNTLKHAYVCWKRDRQQQQGVHVEGGLLPALYMYYSRSRIWVFSVRSCAQLPSIEFFKSLD